MYKRVYQKPVHFLSAQINVLSSYISLFMYSAWDRYFDCTKTLLGISKLGGPLVKSVYLDIT